MIPSKLKKGDHIRVIAPSEGLSPKLTDELRQQGIERLESLGLRVSFGKYVDEQDEFDTATVEHRLEDLHEAFRNPEVNAILAANGGSSANQLLKFIDYDLIEQNPKVFCGLSDLTELTSALYVHSRLTTYYGPHFSMIATSRLIEHSLDSMKKTLFSEDPVIPEPSDHFSDSQWDEEMIVNSPYWSIKEGEAEGKCIGGNLMTVNFLLGNAFFPPLKDAILYLEENHIVDYKGVHKELVEILNHPQSGEIKGIIIGRFQKETEMSRELLTKMIHSKKQLEKVPVIGNVDFSHTVPMISLPFGGKMKIKAGKNDQVKIEVLIH